MKNKKTHYLVFTIHSEWNLSHINEHKSRHDFRDTINPMCACGTEIETTEHFFLRCHFYST